MNAQTLALEPIKKCSCGEVYYDIPKTCRISDDPQLGGTYWECRYCGSTLMLRPQSDEEAEFGALPGAVEV